MNAWKIAYDVDSYPDAFIPEIWAQESLMILEANMVASSLVYRDFSNDLAAFGDVVNTRRPGPFEARRKIASDSVTTQTQTATNVPIALNQHQHVSFVIKDEDASKSFKDLVSTYLQPAVSAIAQALDEIVLCQVYQFLDNSVGKLEGGGSLANLIAVHEKLSTNKVPQSPRYLIISPAIEADLLALEAITSAAWVDDAGEALKNAYLGKRFGMNIFTCQNVPSVPAGSAYNTIARSTTINNSPSGYPAGSTEIVVASGTSIEVGQWLTVAGDMTPQLVTDVGTGTVLTISPGLSYAVAHGATVTVYAHAETTSALAANYAKVITIDEPAIGPSNGRMFSTGLTAETLKKYGVIGTPTNTTFYLDRPLESAIASANTVCGLGPPGEYCFAFHPEAVALVTRPLAPPPSGVGARSAIANYNNLAIRVTLSYDGETQGLRVTVDLLCGIAVLNPDMGVAMLG